MQPLTIGLIISVSFFIVYKSVLFVMEKLFNWFDK